MSNKLPLKPNSISKEAKASMKTRIITALIMAAVCLPCLVLGGWFFFILSVVVSIACSYELVHVLKLQTRFKYIIYVATILLVLGFIYWIFIKNNVSNYLNNKSVDWNHLLTTEFTSLRVSVLLILVMAGIFFGISFICEEFDPTKVFYLIAMVIVTSLCMQSILFLRYSPFKAFSDAKGAEYVNTPTFKYLQSMLLFIYVVIGTISNDIFAYFFGMFFGKHKLNPRISPKKTWEGFYGGMASSFVLSTAFALIFASVGLPLLPKLDINHFYWILLLSAVMPIIANLGDFAFSAIKRKYEIKDFSNVLPGHGGVLDRIDSLLFVSGFIAVMITFINNGWNFFVG